MSWLPKDFSPETNLSWQHYESRAEALAAANLTAASVEAWLKQWSELNEEIEDLGSRLWVAKTVDTTDEKADEYLKRFLEVIEPESKAMNQTLKSKFLDFGTAPSGFEIPLRNMKSEAALYRDENVSLQSEEAMLSTRYGDVVGAQTVTWNGEEVTLLRLDQNLQNSDRSIREKAWKVGMARRLEDRSTLNELFVQLLELRLPQAQNAGYANYVDFRWEQMQRFDYTPEDCEQFHDSIEKVVIPACQKIADRRKKSLGYETLRPWDFSVDPDQREPLRPFSSNDEFSSKAASMLNHVDPELGNYYRVMEQEGLLDLDNRKGKAPGGYCTAFPISRRPFIFMNAVGLHRDVQTLLHEAGHAFHVFESAHWPYTQQLNVNTEFAEVASMSMELLAGDFLEEQYGGYYSKADVARARTEHLEKILMFWPYMAVVDAFQHWVYRNPEEARDHAKCDAKWVDLWDRFMPWEDWSGLENEKATGWHRKLHIFEIPFYYVEYGMAQLGALQVWRNSLTDRAGAVKKYREGLSAGGTITLPEMFRTAGASFAFDTQTIQDAVDLIETKLEEYGAEA